MNQFLINDTPMMLTSAGCNARRKRLWDSVPADTEWLLIADPRHVHYLSNFWVQPLSFSGGERGLLLLERENGATLFGDNFTLRCAAGEPHVDREVVEGWYDHQHSVINRDQALLKAIGTVTDRLSYRPGIVEAEALPLAIWEEFGLYRDSDSPDLGTILRSLRRQKEADEIALLTTCMLAGDAGHARAREVTAAGMTDLDVYREIQSAATAAAGRPILLYGDFRAVNAAQPKAGGLPTGKPLENGDLLILDFSVVIDGYRSDFTNTISIGGPTDDQQKLFQICEAAMKGGEAELKAGAAAKDVYAGVSQPMEAAGYGRLSHHAGHGIGLAHPEPPILVPESADTLLAGDVVTLEPGMYVEGIGGMRIENNYLVTDDGYEKLNNHVISLS